MLNININADMNPTAEHLEEGHLRFCPPVYEQRYRAVYNVLDHSLWKGQLKKVVDFGCGEMKMFPLLKRMPGAEYLIMIDVDEDIITRHGYRMEPFLADYLVRRETPLKSEAYKGSIDKPHSCLFDTDVVIGIEIIEHVYADILENIPGNIFGFIHPKLVILTTPNYDFNVMFGAPQFANGFRHEDHKFEWTRQQFQEWAYRVCEEYTDYYVEFYGIGPGPAGSEHLGCVTQMAVFVRRDMLANFTGSPHMAMEGTEESRKAHLDIQTNSKVSEKIRAMNYDEEKEEIVLVPTNYVEEEPMVEDEKFKMEAAACEELSAPTVDFDITTLHNPHPEDNNNELGIDDYKLIFSYTFPINVDSRSNGEKILHEAQYHINRYLNSEEQFYDNVDGNLKMPLKFLYDIMLMYVKNMDELREVLICNKYTIDATDTIIVSGEFDQDHDDMEEDDPADVAAANEQAQRSAPVHYSSDEEW